MDLIGSRLRVAETCVETAESWLFRVPRREENSYHMFDPNLVTVEMFDPNLVSVDVVSPEKMSITNSPLMRTFLGPYQYMYWKNPEKALRFFDEYGYVSDPEISTPNMDEIVSSYESLGVGPGDPRRAIRLRKSKLGEYLDLTYHYLSDERWWVRAYALEIVIRTPTTIRGESRDKIVADENPVIQMQWIRMLRVLEEMRRMNEIGIREAATSP